MSNAVYIVSVTMENIQSQRIKVTYYLSPHLTCFEGRNNTGKTAINRAFQLFSREHTQQKLLGILNREADRGFVRLDRSDGTYMEVVLTREKKKGRKEGVSLEYIYGNSDDGTIYNKWDSYFPEITDILGWITLRSEQGVMALNFKKSGDQLFIDTPGTVNTIILQELCKVEDLDDRQFNLKVAIDRETEVIDLINKDIIFQNAKLKTLHWTNVDYMEEYRTFLAALKKEVNDIHNATNLANLLLEYIDAKKETDLLKKVDHLISCKLIEKQKQSCIENEAIKNVYKLADKQISEKLIEVAADTYTNNVEDIGIETSLLTEGIRLLNTIHVQEHLNELSNTVVISKAYRSLLSLISYNQLCHNKDRYIADSIEFNSIKLYNEFINKLCITKQLEKVVADHEQLQFLNTLYGKMNKLLDHYELQHTLDDLSAFENSYNLYNVLDRVINEKALTSYWKAILSSEGDKEIYSKIVNCIRAQSESLTYNNWLITYKNDKHLLDLLSKFSAYLEAASIQKYLHTFEELESNQRILCQAIELIPVCPTCGKVLYAEHEHINSKAGE